MHPSATLTPEEASIVAAAVGQPIVALTRDHFAAWLELPGHTLAFGVSEIALGGIASVTRPTVEVRTRPEGAPDPFAFRLARIRHADLITSRVEFSPPRAGLPITFRDAQIPPGIDVTAAFTAPRHLASPEGTGTLVDLGVRFVLSDGSIVLIGTPGVGFWLFTELGQWQPSWPWAEWSEASIVFTPPTQRIEGAGA